MRRPHRSWRWLWWPLGQTRQPAPAETGGDTLRGLWAGYTDPIYGPALNVAERRRHG